MNCPCGTNQSYETCCEPFLTGAALPETAEKLMRSRYTAFARAEMDYVLKTLAPESRKGFDLAGTKRSAQAAQWKSLEIKSTDKGGPEDKKGTVEFTATYEHEGEIYEHHEVAKFRKEPTGQWYFIDGDAHTHKAGEDHPHAPARQETVVRTGPKVGRNDPCTCGSGKKFKKCCGANAAA